MTWKIIEGIDRSGKSSIAELYKKQGYEVVHMSAPDKKYSDKTYVGPSYLDDLLDIVMHYDGKDVVFDRSWYGELVWSYVYGREPKLSEDDLDIFREFEDRNDTQRILMTDANSAAHWQRCVDNKEPLTISQFKTAGILYNKMANKYDFNISELKDYAEIKTENNKQDSSASKQKEPVENRQDKTTTPVSIANLNSKDNSLGELEKLEKANAIRDILSGRLLKRKGGAFDALEEELKNFLRSQLSSIFNEGDSKENLSKEEILVLKLLCKRIKDKEGN